jgi:hypothetical protein
VRDSLELLLDDNRLDKKAIKGLEDYDEVSKLAKTPQFINRGMSGKGLFSQMNDVVVTNPTNGQVPVYNTSTRKWENGTVNTSTPSLQEVTDVGASTTNPITVQIPDDAFGVHIQDLAGNDHVTLGHGQFGDGFIQVYKNDDTVGVSIEGDTVTVGDEAYGAGWNGSTEVPTKNALYDKIETLGTGTIDGTLTATRVPFALDSNTLEDDSLFNFDKTSKSLAIGVATPLARKQHIENATASYTTITGSISSISTSVFDSNVTGSGTLFTAEFQVGDMLVHPSVDAICVTVIRVTSNTSMQVLGTVASGYNGSNWRRLRKITAVRDVSGKTIKTESYGAYSSVTGLGTTPTHIIDGDIFLPNIIWKQGGIYIRSAFNDGRMRIGHVNSTAYFQFTGGNANILAEAITLNNSLWGTPLRLGSANFSTGQTALYMDKTGSGASQTLKISTEAYASNVVQPAYSLFATTFSFGTRNTTWNDYFAGTRTLQMDSTGKWKVGSLGTSDTVTACTTRFDFATVGETFGLKTGTNATIGTATLSGGTITINTTAVTANSMIVLSPARTSTTNLGIHYESARTAGTSFTITSTNASDDSTFDWHLVEKI